MKVFVCLLALAAYAHASAPLLATTKLLSTGSSTSSRTQDAAGNYAFEYSEQGPTGGSSRKESGNGWAAQGSYSLNVGDGRQRIVKYIADGAGFRAAISTNEPGTANLPAADTAIASPYAPPAPVEPLPVPVVAAPAPLAVAAPVFSGWGAPALAPPALPALAAPAPLPAPILAPLPAPIAVTNGWNAAPIAAPVVVKAVPAVSSYSTSIDHVVPAKAAVIAAPAPIVQAPLLKSGW